MLDLIMIFLDVLLKIVKILNSEETPMQVGLGFALGAIMGLVPFFSIHNLVIFLLLCILNVSFRSGILAFIFFFPFGFLFSSIFNALGHWALIDLIALNTFWVDLYQVPYLIFTNWNNTVMLGSVIFSSLLFIPLFLGVMIFVKKYREDLKDKIINSSWYKVMSKSWIFSKVKKVWDLFGGEHA